MKAKYWPCRSVGNRTDRMTEGPLSPRPSFGLPRFCNITPSAAIRAVYSFGLQRPSFRSTSGISRSDMRDGPVRLGAFFMGLDIVGERLDLIVELAPDVLVVTLFRGDE